MINLYFGTPCNDWANQTVNEIAISHEVSIERAGLIMLEYLIENLSEKNKDQSYLDDLFGEFFERIVYAPQILAKQYKQGSNLYPMIHISTNYVIHRMTGDHWPITEELINHAGRKIEDSFGIEFLEYKWMGRQKWLNSKQAELEGYCLVKA